MLLSRGGGVSSSSALVVACAIAARVVDPTPLPARADGKSLAQSPLISQKPLFRARARARSLSLSIRASGRCALLLGVCEVSLSASRQAAI